MAHSFGTLMPISAAARMTEVPAGTVTCSPSISSVTVSSCPRPGVPKSFSLISMSSAPGLLSRAGRLARRAVKSSGKCLIALCTGKGVSPPSAHSDPSIIVSHRSSSR